MRHSFFIILISLFALSCNHHDNKRKGTGVEQKAPVTSDNNMSSANNPANLRTGGLYLFKNKDSTYSFVKILVIDDFAVHVRFYSDSFKTKPIDVQSDDLKVSLGHAPMDKNGFLINNPELVKIELVKESELEGYKMYLEAMSR